MPRDALEFGSLLRARFLSRPNRFLVRCEVPALGIVDAFMPNPGRMRELLLPDAPLFIREASPSANGQRKTRYEAIAVMRHGAPVLLHTGLANAVARRLVETNRVPGLEGARIVRAEVPIGRHRFDFVLEDDLGEILLEVKSCTLFANGVAMFPDAVTERGRRHLLGLATLSRAGRRCAVVFVVHHKAVYCFMPDYHTDPAFSHALCQVRDAVRILPVAVHWTPTLRLGKHVKLLPVPWAYIEHEMADRGAYLLILRLAEDQDIVIGKLGTLRFIRGYYVYVGSAMANLSQRIARHLRRRKRMHWHIDYLRAAAASVEALPIRCSRRIECALADALAQVSANGPVGFGCSDCGCPAHLFHAATHPLDDPAFHNVLEQFRMQAPESE